MNNYPRPILNPDLHLHDQFFSPIGDLHQFKYNSESNRIKLSLDTEE